MKTKRIARLSKVNARKVIYIAISIEWSKWKEQKKTEHSSRSTIANGSKTNTFASFFIEIEIFSAHSKRRSTLMSARVNKLHETIAKTVKNCGKNWSFVFSFMIFQFQNTIFLFHSSPFIVIIKSKNEKNERIFISPTIYIVKLSHDLLFETNIADSIVSFAIRTHNKQNKKHLSHSTGIKSKKKEQ